MGKKSCLLRTDMLAMSRKNLYVLNENGIVVLGMPTNTSHVIQPLDVSVFAPAKEKFHRLLSSRTITTTKNYRTDIFTICELLRNDHHAYVNPKNSISGFRRKGILFDDQQSVDLNKVEPADISCGSVSHECTEYLPSTRSTTTFMHFTQQVYLPK